MNMKYDISKTIVPKMPKLGRGLESVALLLSQVSKERPAQQSQHHRLRHRFRADDGAGCGNGVKILTKQKIYGI